MKKIFFLIVIFASTVLAQPQIIQRENTHYLSNTIMIKLNGIQPETLLQTKLVKNALPQKFEKVFSENPTTLHKGTSPLSNVYTFKYSSGDDPQELSQKIKKLKGVEWAEPKYVRKVTYQPNDPLYNESQQMNLSKIFADSAWSITKGDTNVVIAIVDTGVDWTHPDLAANIFINRNEIPNNGIDEDDNGDFPDDVNGWDFGGLDGTPDNNPAEDLSSKNSYHGTHVAGIAGAVTDNATGIASIGFNCRILPVKVSQNDMRDVNDYAYVVYGYEGIVYAANKGAKVINCSWGGYSASEYEKAVVNYAISKGSLIVAAAGNNNIDTPFYPASYDGVLSVGWLNTNDDTKSFAANYGGTVDVMAPGSSILSTWQRSGSGIDFLYFTINGSSMASPLVAGLAGLVFTRFPNYTPLQIAEQIRMTADNIDSKNPGFEKLLGRGRINAFNAVNDTGKISIRTTDIAYIEDGNGNGMFNSGESFSVGLTLTNYLERIDYLNVSVESSDPSVAVTLLPTSIGPLESLQTIVNAYWFKIDILPEAPLDHRVNFLIRYSAAGHEDFQWFSIKINPTYETHSTNKITMTVTSKGALGYNDYSSNQEGVGFQYLGDKSLMFEGAFMYGTSTDRLMDAARLTDSQSDDFKMIIPIKIISPGTFAFQEGYANFDDSGATNRLGISTHFYTYTFNEPLDENYLIIRTALNNSSQQRIDSLYAGYFIDWDIPEDDYANNTTQYDSLDNFAYAYNTNSPNVYVGTALLSHNSYGYYPIKNDAASGDVRLFDADGYTDAEKFISLSNGVISAFDDVSDISYVVSGGPFVLEPLQTMNVAYSIAAASTLEELRSAIRRSREKYQSIPTNVKETKQELPTEFTLYQNYPNPFNPTTTIKFSVPNSQFVTLKVYDILGREISKLVDEYKATGTYSVFFNAGELSSGIYFYNLRTGNYSSTKKMVLIR
ncbi:MAG: S8 family serine peptidase [Melioribacteraceae bacterium]|nr:S8 family serine peptidase [Melioribacteraceae bacterium]